MPAEGALHPAVAGRGAAPVRFTFGQAHGWFASQRWLCAAAVAWLTAWFVVQDEAWVTKTVIVQMAVAGLVLGFVGAGSWWLRGADAGASLAWTGDHWCFQPMMGAVQTGSLAVALDLGLAVILVWTPEQSSGRPWSAARSRWMLAERQMDRHRWSSFRRAIHQRARSVARSH
jgi:hypothetical protein